jgi:hypothetical protein
MSNLRFYLLLALLTLLLLVLTGCRMDNPPAAEAPVLPPPVFYTIHAFENGKPLDYWSKATQPVLVQSFRWEFTNMVYGERYPRKVVVIGNPSFVVEENMP